ncbi:MAG: lytic transglycosylase domain-containing protein [Bradyrhizobium sp.]
MGMSSALAIGLTISVGFTAFAANTVIAKKVPLPRPRPIMRHVAPNAVAARKTRGNSRNAHDDPLGALAEATAAVPPAAARPMRLHVAPVTRLRVAPPPRGTPFVTAAVAATSFTSQTDKAALKKVINLVHKGRQGDATTAEASISDPVARKLAEWIVLRSPDNGASFERYRAFIAANPSWPSLTLLRMRLEATLWDDKRDDQVVWSWFDHERPLSAKGRLALAKAMLDRGDRAGAARLVRETWRNDDMSEATEHTVLDLFGALLTPADHVARLDTLLYGSERNTAMREARRLGVGYVALAKARIAANRMSPHLRARLEAVPRRLRGDAGYLFSEIQLLRREKKYPEAARLMLSAPRDPARLLNVDQWWIERRLEARHMIDLGRYRTAYMIARDAATPQNPVYKTEQQFTAGWIALRFLHDPQTALRHFERIGVGSVNPTTLARAGYWQGRAYEAAGQLQKARAAYAAAARQSTSYYGQLARAKLGWPQLALRPAPRDRNAGNLEIVRAVQLLYDIGERQAAILIFANMGRHGDPNALVGLAEAAYRHGDARGMVLVGKAALNRGLPFDFYAYPVIGVPRFAEIGPAVDRSVIYSIARQESEFDPTAVSPAHAYGLMQVTSGAGRYICRRAGIRFNLKRMKSDPVYDTALGAAELGGLLKDYRGSYIMAFAAYNAGRGNLKKWIARYGDPRDPRVNAVDWVELIPFSETRNYVERVMENLQVYRARFGGGSRLQIEADLHRGAIE